MKFSQAQECEKDAAEQKCGRNSGIYRYKEIPWWDQQVKEAVRRKNDVWRRWFIHKTDENRTKWKRKYKQLITDMETIL